MKFNVKILLLFVLFAVVSSGGCGGSNSNSLSGLRDENERMIQAMTLEEKVAQLLVIRPEHLNTAMSIDAIHYTRTSADIEVNSVMLETLKKYPVGGFALFAQNIKSPEQLKKFTADLKNACDIEPFMCIDEEGGRVARLGNKAESFDIPRIGSMQSIGETGDTQNAYDAAYTIGGYLKDYGFNLDFAPVADINTNPDNIVIGDRAFGSDPDLVSRMVSAFLEGLHAQGVMGTIKHFPGHGDTTSDTHTGYVAVYKTWDELMQAELIPFIDNIDLTDVIMPAHITLKNIISEDVPATLSYEILTEKLRGELGYNGVIITDSLEMGAINNTWPSGEACVKAIEAGNDLLLVPYNYIQAFEALLNAVRTGRISEERINQSLRRIFALKFREAK